MSLHSTGYKAAMVKERSVPQTDNALGNLLLDNSAFAVALRADILLHNNLPVHDDTDRFNRWRRLEQDALAAYVLLDALIGAALHFNGDGTIKSDALGKSWDVKLMRGGWDSSGGLW